MSEIEATTALTEYGEAIALAERLLDEPNADPDDDLHVLSRQFIRATERREKRTLASQVSDLACRAINLESLACDMLATVKINFERGYLVAQNDEGKLNLERIVAMWERQLAEFRK